MFIKKVNNVNNTNMLVKFFNSRIDYFDVFNDIIELKNHLLYKNQIHNSFYLNGKIINDMNIYKFVTGTIFLINNKSCVYLKKNRYIFIKYMRKLEYSYYTNFDNNGTT